MWSLCGGREGKAEAAAESSEDTGVFSGSEAYRPNRGLAREMIDEQAMAPSAQVEVPAGTPRSNFVVGGRGGGPAGAAAGWPGAAGPSGAAPATLSSYNTANVQGFRQQATAGATSVQGGGSAEVDAQSEILGEELKKEGNQLYNEGQLEAAELVYSEALKARALSRRAPAQTQRHGACQFAARGIPRPPRPAPPLGRATRLRATPPATPRARRTTLRPRAALQALPAAPQGASSARSAALGARLTRLSRAVRAQELHPVLKPLHVLRQARAIRGESTPPARSVPSPAARHPTRAVSRRAPVALPRRAPR